MTLVVNPLLPHLLSFLPSFTNPWRRQLARTGDMIVVTMPRTGLWTERRQQKPPSWYLLVLKLTLLRPLQITLKQNVSFLEREKKFCCKTLTPFGVFFQSFNYHIQIYSSLYTWFSFCKNSYSTIYALRDLIIYKWHLFMSIYKDLNIFNGFMVWHIVSYWSILVVSNWFLNSDFFLYLKTY